MAAFRPSFFLLASALLTFSACSDSDDEPPPDDMMPEDMTPSGNTCDPTTILPANYRLIPAVSAGTVQVTTTGGITSGVIDASAGGTMMAADNPYIYVDLKTGTKVDVSDVDARESTNWDIMLKRTSLRTNSGDSGKGNRKLSIVEAASLDAVTAAPADGYEVDDFASEDCKTFVGIAPPAGVGEPMSAFLDWYNYDEATHIPSPKPVVYVLERNNGTHTAFRFTQYASGKLTIEFKQL